MDTKTLVVGQDVFMRSGQVGNWAKVVEVTPTGVIVESDPVYGSELIRFDENGAACDSSDLCNDKGIRGGLTIPIMGSGPWKLYSNPKEAGFERIMAPGETAESLVLRCMELHRQRMRNQPRD
jgi:hypothetical protein